MSLKQTAHSAAGVLLAAGLVLTPAAHQTVVAQTGVRDSPPASLIAALSDKAADVYTKIVFPCRDEKQKVIAKERQDLEKCSECRAQLPDLVRIEKAAMARCDIKGYDQRIADIDGRIDQLVQQLKTLNTRFLGLAQSNATLTEEIKAGETEAMATFTEAAVGDIMDYVLNYAPDKQIELIEAAEARMQEVKDVRRVTKRELGTFVAEMRAELQGKSKSEARAILLAKLQRVKLLANGIKEVNFASGEIASHNIDHVMGVKSEPSAELIDTAYGALVTNLQIVQHETEKKLLDVIVLNHVLGYSRDAIKIGLVFANLNQLGKNVDGLASLSRAADSQRKIAKSQLDYLIKQRKALVEERAESESVANEAKPGSKESQP